MTTYVQSQLTEFWTDRNSSVTYFNDFLNASHVSPVKPSPKLWETLTTPALQTRFYPAVWQREGSWTQNMVMVQREALTSSWGIRRHQHLQNFSTCLKCRHDVSLADWQLSRIEGSQLRWATLLQFSSVLSLSCVRLFATPWIAARQASLSITNSQSSLRLMSIESVMPSNHLILCRPLLLLSSIPPSIRVFSNESTLPMRWPNYWSFSFSIIPSKEIPGLISFRMDWLDLLEVQGTLKSLL